MADARTLDEVFGAKLRRLRSRARLSQEALAVRAGGLHGTEISLLERGEREPRLSTIILLARAPEVKASTFLRGVDDAVIRERRRKPTAGLPRRAG